MTINLETCGKHVGGHMSKLYVWTEIERSAEIIDRCKLEAYVLFTLIRESWIKDQKRGAVASFCLCSHGLELFPGKRARGQSQK